MCESGRKLRDGKQRRKNRATKVNRANMSNTSKIFAAQTGSPNPTGDSPAAAGEYGPDEEPGSRGADRGSRAAVRTENQ
jgi:hypothetical protein